MTKFKIATTEQLIKINDDAVKHNRNRAIYTDALDPNGTHVLAETYVLDDGATIRTQWLIKITNIDAPETVFIDVDPALTEPLPFVYLADAS